MSKKDCTKKWSLTGKVKFTIEHAIKVLRRRRGITILFL